MVEPPRTEEELKIIAKGPLGEELSKFPMRFAAPVFFGNRPSRNRPGEINNGTITLVNLGDGPLGITCWHVIDGYRKRLKEDPTIIFQIEFSEFDPLAQIIDESESLDLAVIHLTEAQVKTITSVGEIGSCVFCPKSWPPPELKVGGSIAFGGFPASLKTLRSFDEIDFPSWSSGASRVSSVSNHKFISAFEREYWVSAFGEKYHMELDALGGMSGGPAFINRGLYWDLVGIITDHEENYDAMIFTSTRMINTDGTIKGLPI